MALADYQGFHSDGFHVVALLDSDPAKLGRRSRSGAEVLPLAEMTEIVRREAVEIGIIAVPAEVAQNVYDTLVDAGINAVLNFAPVQIRLREGVKIKSVDLRISLETLSFHLTQVEDEAVHR
jgi:redox-sensing transcriptional repressor